MRPLFALALFLSAPAFAQTPDTFLGGQMARQWCAGCHQVAPGGDAQDTVPRFVEIARRPGTTAETLAAFLRQPHGRMPDLNLTEANIRPLIAYIISLR